MASMTLHFLDVGMGDGTLVQMRSGNDVDAPCELALVDFGEKRTPSKIPYTDAMTYLVTFIDGNSKARNLRVPYVDILFLTQALNAVLLMPLLWFMRGVAGDRRTMGEHALGPTGRAVTLIAMNTPADGIGTRRR